MSISRGSFLRALIGAPFAAKAVERMIAAGGPAPVKPIEPVKPTVQAPYEARIPMGDKYIMISGLVHFPEDGRYVVSG